MGIEKTLGNHLATPTYDKYSYDALRRLTSVEYGASSGWAALLPGEMMDLFDMDMDNFENMTGFQIILVLRVQNV